ncbi:MAG: hypothetical protein IKC09_05475 [Oscillospiraceae bacterium]|nr:hypothetical protein [Oscillospiraceae bacterium]
MARHDKDFRPDREDSGLWGQLYLTKKQRLSAAKWLLYSLVVLALSVVQDVMLSSLDLRGATTDLVPCAILTVCILEGADSGSLFSLLAATVYLFSGTAPGVHVVVLLPLLGVIASVFRQNYLRKSFFTTVLCAGAMVLVYELTVFGVALFVEQTYAARVTVALITAGLSCLAIPLLYPILVSIGKIGGETWKE